MQAAGKRRHKVVIEREQVTGKDSFNADVVEWVTWSTDMADIFFGSGREQREAAQESASQAASFEVLSHAKTRALLATDRLRYPVTDPVPANWPIWDIQAFNDLGANEGVRITATRAVE